MYQVIARKYRPQTFQDVVNQEHVKTTLENAIAQNRIAHGYIFSGQRGTGKTTVARILARCLNCEQGPTSSPCGECASCREITSGGTVDLIEIDAASNRGINEMRELRENVRYQPARDHYKVFIIDEAHQITTEAFNALLKTIEEPPPWVVFVLCTTEAHKIPATIASRCQHFSFRSVEFEALTERMAWICKQEGIEADPEALAVLAQAGEGSVRDSLSALDQAIACCSGKLGGAEVRALLGVFSLESLGRVAGALAKGDAGRMLEVVDELERSGHNLQHFTRELSRYFRNLLVARISGAETRLIAASSAQRQRLAEVAAQFSEEDLTRYLQLTLDLFRDTQFSLQPRFHLEMGLVRMVYAGRLLPIEEALASLGSPRPAAAPSAPPAVAPPRTPVISAPAPSAAPVRSAAPPVESAGGSSDLRERLHARLMDSGLSHLADAVEGARLTLAGSELQVAVSRQYKLYFSDPALIAAVKETVGKPVKISVTVVSDAAAPLPEVRSQAAERPVSASADPARDRALGDPEVKRFQELFPGSSVYQVRNLKE
jgi:DNA polymerase III subunit gamma/tau